MKKVLTSLIVVTLLVMFPLQASAQRIAECDACGYCNGKERPENWDDCKRCLYPSVTPVDGRETLRVVTTPMVDPQNPNKIIVNVPIPPLKGRYFTQLGCVDTSLSSFSDPAASGGVLNFLLTRLIFPSTGILAFGALIYGAYILMMAQGAQMEVARGKRYITGAVVGLIFTFSVVLIVNIVGVKFLRIPGIGEGNEIIIEATGSVSISLKDPPPPSLRYPTINVYVDDTLVKSIPNATGNIQVPHQSPENFPGNPYVFYSIPADVQPGQTVRVEFANDYYPDRGASGDVNLFVKDTISIDGKNCIDSRYITKKDLDSGANTVRLPYNGVFNMHHDGSIFCTAP